MNEIKELENKMRLTTTRRLQDIVEDYGVSPETIGKLTGFSTKHIYRWLSDMLVIPFEHTKKFSDVIIAIENMRNLITDRVTSWPVQNNISTEAKVFNLVFHDRKMLRIFNLKNKDMGWKIQRLLNIVLKAWAEELGE